MRLVMMGTGPFAVPSFETLLDSAHDVVALVTRPVEPARGRRQSPVNPMRDVGESRGVLTIAPDRVNDPAVQAQLAALQADLFVVCDYGQILSSATLGCSRLGGINLHGSLLPKYRGAAPIQWAMYHGAATTGVTVIHMSPKLDAGPCLVQRETPIGPDETAVDVEARLSQLGVDAVVEALDLLAAWDGETAIGEIQDATQATKAPRLKKSDGQVDWTRAATEIKNQVRAFQPWPKTFVDLQHADREPLRLILDRVSIVGDASPTGEPRHVVSCDANHVWVATGRGTLSLDRVQPAGKRVMSINEFLRGHPVHIGDRFLTSSDS